MSMNQLRKDLPRILSGETAISRLAQDAEWKEGDHKRADNGQFGSGGGGAAPKKQSVNDPMTPEDDKMLAKANNAMERTEAAKAKHAPDDKMQAKAEAAMTGATKKEPYIPTGWADAHNKAIKTRKPEDHLDAAQRITKALESGYLDRHGAIQAKKDIQWHNDQAANNTAPRVKPSAITQAMNLPIKGRGVTLGGKKVEPKPAKSNRGSILGLPIK